MRLSGKAAIVTGAAHGIGRAVAELLAEEGAAVLIADIDDAAGSDLARTLTARGLEAAYVHADVALEEDVKAVVRLARERNGGRVDILINNASYLGQWHDAAAAPREEWDRCYETALLGAACFLREVVPVMKERGGGAIVNVASVQGIVGARSSAAYTSIKHGLIGLTRSAAYDFAAWNIRVNAVCPGAIQTRISPPAGSEVLERQIAKTPLGRVGQPREVAQAVLFLASEDASYVTGAVLPVDGGWTAV